MKNQTQRQLILEDNLWKVMWKLSWPAVIAMILYGLNVVFDAIFVGHFVGETALAGISMVYPLSQFPLGLGSMIGTGAGAALSIWIGQNDRKAQSRLLGHVNVLILLVSAGTMLIGFWATPGLLRSLGAEGQVYQYGLSYFHVVLIGTVLWIGGLAYNMIIRAEGKMGTAALIMGIGLLANIVANYFFIAVLKLGVQGAAWGTNLAMLIYVLLFFYYCHAGHASFETHERKFYFEAPVIKRIISLGIPNLLMALMTVFQGLVIMKSLNRYGSTEDIAFYGVVFRLFNFLLTPIFGLMRALQPTLGINYGAKQYQRVIRSYWVFTVAALAMILPFFILTMLFPESFLSLMIPGKAFADTAIANFRIFLALLPLMPIVFMGMTYAPAVEKPGLSAIFLLARQLVLYIPLMIILPRYWGIDWIYRGSFCIDAFLAAVILWVVLRDFKRLGRLEKEALHLKEA